MAGGPLKQEDKHEKTDKEKAIHKEKEPMIVHPAPQTDAAKVSERVGTAKQEVMHGVKAANTIDHAIGKGRLQPSPRVPLANPQVVKPTVHATKPLQVPLTHVPIRQPPSYQPKPEAPAQESIVHTQPKVEAAVKTGPPIKKPVVQQPVVMPRLGDKAKAELAAKLMQKKPVAKQAGGGPQKGGGPPAKKPAQKAAPVQKPSAPISGQALEHKEQEPDAPDGQPPDGDGKPIIGDALLAARRKMMLESHLPAWDAFNPTLPQRKDSLQCVEIFRKFDKSLRDIMLANEDCFLPGDPMPIGQGQTISFGKPMQVGPEGDPRLDLVIPVYLTSGGVTQFIVAYMSQSQAIWRRFAGCDKTDGHYCKGPRILPMEEHYQAFDTVIQKKLDHIFAKAPLSRKPAFSLESLGLMPKGGDEKSTIEMVKGGEGALQKRIVSENAEWKSMQADNQPTQLPPEQLPARLVDTWISGSDEGVYGRHLNLLMRSADGKLDYCIAVTEDGMFVKYVQMAGGGAVTDFGAPMQVPKIARRLDWLLAPIIEYDSQTEDVKDEQPSIRRRATIVTGDQGRERMRGLHEDAHSPLNPVYNGVKPLFALIRLKRVENAKGLADLFITNKYPITSAHQLLSADAGLLARYATERLKVLEDAYALYLGGASPKDAEAEMAAKGLLPRDIFLVRRYWTEFDKDLSAYARAIVKKEYPALSGDAAKEKYVLAHRNLIDAYALYARDPVGNLAVVTTKVKYPQVVDLFKTFEPSRKARFEEEAHEWGEAMAIAGAFLK
ncbi:hypothetical protein L0Y65_02255 [Candidatus Micrarchaeota archaeon]|nr:hypothetical protein [Candidatus Micrarchaeota archaeon]